MTKKVLVVDDELDIAYMIQARLEQEGLQVNTASDGCEALKKIAASRPDLILMDVAMPHLGGLEVLKILKADEATASIPVVLLTALDTYADMERGWERGSDLYLTKPMNMTQLVDCVRAIFNQADDRQRRNRRTEPGKGKATVPSTASATGK